MQKIIFSVCLISSVAIAARVEDVKVLQMKPGPENIELRLQTKNGPKDSYFIVDITKQDPESFDKVNHALKKMMQKEKYRLDLEIPSFSPSPSGSYYKSDGIVFTGTGEREPGNMTNSKKVKK